MKVFLDDKRLPKEVYPNELDWELVYTAWKAIQLLATGKVTEISLDHDLGENINGTGYDVVKWIEEQVFTNESFNVPIIKIHSANPVGRKNMEAAIESINRHKR